MRNGGVRKSGNGTVKFFVCLPIKRGRNLALTRGGPEFNEGSQWNLGELVEFMLLRHSGDFAQYSQPLCLTEIGGGVESLMTNPVPNLGVFQKLTP